MPVQSAFVRRMGEGERKLLALHCTIAHSGAWSGLSVALNGTATLIAPDMPSHGRSPDWDGSGDYFDLVTSIARAQLNEPMDVIGHSFGAMVALRLAIEHPDLVRSAVLIEPVFFAIAQQDAPHLFEQHEREVQPINDAFTAGDKPRAARLFNRMWSTQISPRWPDLPDWTRAAMIRGIDAVPAVHGAVYNDNATLLKPKKLERASMPILLLSGSETHPVMPAICDGLNLRLPAATHAVVAGAGHMVPISHPQQTAALLQEFRRS
ncbi:alpha/beta hydrolase [Rhodobacteraceae bacterium B1Z28]|uniref:Alpha/beta hydrolase n=2 Tax=Ruegeria haliotis TaxID=2747601 RepID=A0ABX2PMN6_9RHOB|nr:alpha/beta hydrolase [Ruegeria haliotis]